jgi:hypothetical protein
MEIKAKKKNIELPPMMERAKRGHCWAGTYLSGSFVQAFH